MKNLILVFVVAFAFCTTAMASDIAFYVGQWNTDGWYDASQFDDVDTIIAQTGHLFNDIQQFDDTELAAFGTWVDDHTNNGVMDIIWLNGCTPTVLYPQGNTSPDGSRAELWLDGGNMIINVGDWFAYCSFEGGTRLDPDNGSAGAANILDLDASVIDDGTNAAPMVVTAAGATYLPSLNQVTSTRPVVLSQVTGDWEVAEVFAQNAAGTYADPVVIHNTATDGYLAIINQSTNWIADRGQTCAEFIANWARGLLSANPYPFNPSPTDGSTIDGYLYPPDYIYVVLTFEEGDWADSHVVYFSDNEALVNALDPSVSLGGPPDPLNPRTFYAGVPLPEWTPYNDSLVRGNTYYWCAVTTDVNGTPWQGPTWDFYVALAKASNPSPADGAKFLSLDPTLSWGAGVTEGYSSPHAHEIYFGTNYDDVNNATAGGPLHRATQSFGDETWEPNSDGGLTLDYSTDYYWRIDEKHGSFTITRVTGDVWKFTTGREGGGLRADFFEFPAQATPSRAVAFANLVHTRFDPEINFTWLAGPPDPCVAADGFASRWVGAVEAGWTETYTFNARTDDGVRLWIGGELIIDDWVEQGMSDAFSTTVNSTDWEIVPSGALYPPYWAYNPDPPNGAHTVDPAEFVQCTWTSGDYTAQHKVYWCEGDDPNLLTLVATKPVGEPNYDPGPLALETNYCWRVDEVNGTAEYRWH
ncbi:MAG: hypothetical protein AMJ46_14220 [Latescibacteria bacterium DG_63]|nr:MAG: hypothetical protein AMJ46_14220 [Latescibacteria bacterium DG_63]